ncbi:MAG: ATP-dependent RecD-like DNA helicase [Acidobacteriota bacterium]
MDQPSQIEGVVERIVFANRETGWAVVSATVRGRGEMTLTGPLLGVQPGETLKVTGSWVHDRRYGKQLQVERFETVRPATLIGIERYLSSGLVEGIGGTLAKGLVQAFGLDTLEVIDHQPERLREVPGIGAKRSERIVAAWKRQRGVRDVMVFLRSHGISANWASKIHRHYGDDALRVVQETPHRLARDIFGIGFVTADKIARDVGVAKDAPERADAGVLHILRQGVDQGHLFLPEQDLLTAAARLLDLAGEPVEAALGRLLDAGDLVAADAGDPLGRGIFPRRLARAEAGLAAGLRALTAQKELPLDIEVERAVAWYESRSGIELASQQRHALAMALTSKVLVLTGGPGTGKTTLIRGVVEILGKKGLRLALTAPTGRAARRLADATGEDAKTLHRLLEFQPETRRFARGPGHPLSADLVVVDEASMLDVSLAHSLVSALPRTARLLLVGDIDQLPSIGPGRVLADLIESGGVPVARLTEIFRQARRSLIVVNAHRVRDGLVPLPGTGPESADGSDFFFIERQEPAAILDTLKHLVTERIPGHFGFTVDQDIQVLTPMRRGLLGAANLNAELQAQVNPEGATVARGSSVLRQGDRVMQRRNNYDLGVFNGDVGRILAFELGEQRASVDLEGRIVSYPFAKLDELTLAYACSIHKSQGSEYPCVVVPLHTQHYALLQRNLLYTAITRGRKLVVVVGSRRALGVAVHERSSRRRNTLLVRRLRGEI